MVEDHVKVWSDVTWISVTSPTSVDFLQGYLTCETGRLTSTSLTPMAICNIQGRVVASGWAVATREDCTHLLVHQTLQRRVIDFLNPYARFARVQVAAEKTTVALKPAGLPLYGGFVGNPDDPSMAPADGSDISESMRHALINDHFALISAPVSEKYLPQMLDLHERAAVDFDKGCYLGQEVVARAQFRGAVKRKLIRFEWQGDHPEIGRKNPEGDIVICIASSPEDEQSGIGLAVA